MADKATLIKAVRDHALANYGKGGWDYLVECWDDDDILKAIGKAETEKGAIRNCAMTVGAMDEQRSEAKAAGEW